MKKSKNLSSGVDKSHETRWQNGKDIPEADAVRASPTRKVSGSEVSLKQSCGDSVPPTQNTTHVRSLPEQSGKTELTDIGGLSSGESHSISGLTAGETAPPKPKRRLERNAEHQKPDLTHEPLRVMEVGHEK